MNRYWIAIAGGQNSGEKKSRLEAVAWANDLLGKNANMSHVSIAEIHSRVKRTNPSTLETDHYLPNEGSSETVRSTNGQHDALGGMDF